MTAANIAAKKKQYPSMVRHIPSEGGANSKNIGTDCIGILCAACSVPDTKGGPMGSSDAGMMYYASKNGKAGNAFMDSVSAEGARLSWGAKQISTIPEPTKEKPAIAVFIPSKSGSPGHIGLYLGGGDVIESTPPRVQITKLKARRTTSGSTAQWTHWAFIPEKWLMWAGSYFGEVSSTPAPENIVQRPLEAQSDALRIGGRVTIKKYGVPYFPGGAIIPNASWLMGKVMTVNGLSDQGKPPVPCARLAEISSWCAVENLVKVEVG